MVTVFDEFVFPFPNVYVCVCVAVLRATRLHGLQKKSQFDLGRGAVGNFFFKDAMFLRDAALGVLWN
jgi:hypothetical protein